MSTVNADEDRDMARCSRCDHDLVAKPELDTKDEVKVYCSNPACWHSNHAHPTAGEPNVGRR